VEGRRSKAAELGDVYVRRLSQYRQRLSASNKVEGKGREAMSDCSSESSWRRAADAGEDCSGGWSAVEDERSGELE
jgi:hypothetical protein